MTVELLDADTLDLLADSEEVIELARQAKADKVVTFLEGIVDVVHSQVEQNHRLQAEARDANAMLDRITSALAEELDSPKLDSEDFLAFVRGLLRGVSK